MVPMDGSGQWSLRDSTLPSPEEPILNYGSVIATFKCELLALRRGARSNGICWVRFFSRDFDRDHPSDDGLRWTFIELLAFITSVGLGPWFRILVI